MFVVVENAVSHTTRSDDRTGHHSGNLFAWTGQSEYRDSEDGFAVCALGK